MKKAALAALGLLLAALAGWYAWPESAPQPPPGAAAPAPARPLAKGLFDWPPADTAQPDEPSRVPLLPLEPAQLAAASLAEARENGDERAPPVLRSPPAEQATPAELADPQAYGRFEAQQHLRLLGAYVHEAERAVPQLRADIERGRASGIDSRQLAQAEEKARRIGAMRAQLLAEHPELAGR